MEALLRNLRYAARRLARAPGFTITVVLTLAVGIGASSAVFSAIDAILLRPLPFPDADRLVRLNQFQQDSSGTDLTPARLHDWNRLSSAFDGITGYTFEDISDTTGDVPEKVRRATVQPRLFDVFGIAPARGRVFADAEHQFGGPSAVIISHRYWRTRLGGDPNVLDKAVRSGDRSYSIVGVMPPSFRFLDRDVDWWVPELLDSPWVESRRGGRGWYIGIGRLKRDVTLEQGHADLELVQAQLAEQYPDTDRDIRASVVPLKDSVVGGVRESLWLLFGAVTVLMLIACANIAALLLARAAEREQEIAVRYSLGASRAAVLAQTLTEALVLAVAGTAAGLLVATGASAAFRVLAPELPRLDEAAIDTRVLLYMVASAVVAALVCGLAPAVRSARGHERALRSGRTQVSSRHSFQWTLVGVQVALSVTLLAGAGLLLRSMAELSRVAPGFDPAHVLTFRVSARFGEDTDDRIVQRIDRTLDELRALAGVEAAATSLSLPGIGERGRAEFELVGGRAEAESPMVAEWRAVSAGYLDTMQIPLLAGEPCRRDARETSQMLVNRSFVERFLPGRSVMGLQLAGSMGGSGRIVGIVGDAREAGIALAPAPTVYFCLSAPSPFPWFLVRTRGEPMTVAGAVRNKINDLEPLRAVFDIRPLERWIGDAHGENRLRTVLLVLFAVTALSLACLGVYGTLGYVVSLRRREVGLRVALGALSRNIVAQFLSRALRVVGLACFVGLALSFAFTGVLSGMLYGVSPSDLITRSAVVAIVAAVAVLAALVPAMRASRIDPMRALREE